VATNWDSDKLIQLSLMKEFSLPGLIPNSKRLVKLKFSKVRVGVHEDYARTLCINP